MASAIIDRALRGYPAPRPLSQLVAATGAVESRAAALSDPELAETHHVLSAEHERGRSLEDLAPEFFARAREAARRSLGLRPYDVQVFAAAAMSRGCIAEARTGEGKTLSAALALGLQALAGASVHAVTANPYLAARDAELMGPLYRALGLSVGVVLPEHAGQIKRRQEAYAARITYGTTSEFGFDYLRDNMAYSRDAQVQRGHGFCLIDEVDAVLIDEARTPLIISGPADDHSLDYRRFSDLVAGLRRGEDYLVDETLRTVTTLEGALLACERMLGEDLHSPANVALVNHLVQALRAKELQQRDRHYLVRGEEVVLIDEPTGRVVPGRQWGEGLYQAVQAKEGLPITPESATLASISVQNYFRLYERLGGTTGTAAGDREELLSVYGLPVHRVPTHRPVVRVDAPDVIYRGQAERLEAVVAETRRLHARGQPVLIGTPTVAMSESVSAAFTTAGLAHETLNAKDPAREAQIIARAGERGAITIATNMAGRGVDIRLGDGVAQLGGLCVIGTARNDSRRVDDQLRGRSGRQGDPGYSRFYLAADDELVRLFGGAGVPALMAHLPGHPRGPIELPALAAAVHRAQRSVERQGFETRQHLLEYDETVHRQRLAFFKERQLLVEGADLGEYLPGWIVDVLCDDEPAADTLRAHLSTEHVAESSDPRRLAREVTASWRRRRQQAPALHAALERLITLTLLDRYWQAHLESMAALRDGIEFHSLSQEDPVVAYALEGDALFVRMQTRARAAIVETVLATRLLMEDGPGSSPPAEAQRP